MNRPLFCVVAAAALLAGCTSTSDPDPLKSGVQVSFSTRSLTSPAPPAPAAPALSAFAASGDTLRDGTNTLIIDQAQVVVRKVELERSGSSQCSSQSTGCEEVEAGPVLVDLPLVPGAPAQFTIDAPIGSYSKIKFEIHKVSEGDPAEQPFRDAHPELQRNSILVRGRFNGQPFTFLSDVNAQQDLELAPALVVTAGGGAVNVTIRVDISAWFRASGGGLLDPATANKGGSNENRVSGNIRNSMRAFEDHDHDGDDRDG